VQDWSQIFGVGCSSSRTSNVIFDALATLNLEAMNKAASHELPTLPDLYLLLDGQFIMGSDAGRFPVTESQLHSDLCVI
jgi:hypothetical protein